MRTTLDIEPDILQAAKELATREGTTAGRVLSRLARQALLASSQPSGSSSRHGVPVLSSRGDVVTLDHINKLMADEGI